MKKDNKKGKSCHDKIVETVNPLAPIAFHNTITLETNVFSFVWCRGYVAEDGIAEVGARMLQSPMATRATLQKGACA
jgi:hypothetical protein